VIPEIHGSGAIDLRAELGTIDKLESLDPQMPQRISTPDYSKSLTSMRPGQRSLEARPIEFEAEQPRPFEITFDR